MCMTDICAENQYEYTYLSTYLRVCGNYYWTMFMTDICAKNHYEYIVSYDMEVVTKNKA